MSVFGPSTSALVATAEPLLVAIAGVLALVIVGLIALAWIVRRRTAPGDAPVTTPPRAAAPPMQASPPPRPRVRTAVARGGGGGGLAVATSSAMVCPTCRTEYHGLTYCTRDARRLVPPEEMLGGPLRALPMGKSAGLVCMACRRAYEPGLRSCPHDGNELVPSHVYNATRPRRGRPTEPANVIARICPVCGAKFDLNARFCGHDAGELVVIN
jgi:hypothetical protein